ncbi:hypothetical protein Tco_1378841 [Tanacetum coccineum]
MSKNKNDEFQKTDDECPEKKQKQNTMFPPLEVVDIRNRLKRTVEDFPSFMSSSASLDTYGKMVNGCLDTYNRAKESFVEVCVRGNPNPWFDVVVEGTNLCVLAYGQSANAGIHTLWKIYDARFKEGYESNEMVSDRK